MRQRWTVTILFIAILSIAPRAHAQDETCIITTPQGTGFIQGTVTSEESSQPVFSTLIALGEGPGFSTLIGTGFTNIDGTYSIDVPAPATYVVAALPVDQVHAPEFHDGVLTRAAATKISVADGETVEDVDFTVIVGATIEGNVTAEDGGAPLQGVGVQAVLIGDLPHVGVAQTDASGDYTLHGLAEADYQVTFVPQDTPDNYLTEVYNDSFSPPGDPVSVTLPGVTGIDAALEKGGRIEGNVTGPNDQALASVPVLAITDGPYQFGRTATDNNGDYSMVVATGTYNVVVTATPGLASEFYDGKFTLATADDVSVTAPNTTSGIDVQLGQSGKITGQITDSVSGDPIPFAIAIATEDNGVAEASGAVAIADAQGNYELDTNLHTGEYKVGFFATAYRAAFYQNKTSPLDADPVSVTAPDVTPNIDQALVPCDQATTTTIGGTTTTLGGTTTTLGPTTTTTLGGTTTTTGATTTSLSGTTTTTLDGGGPTCGDPVALTSSEIAGGDELPGDATLPRAITASDALQVLRAAVGSASCELCVCDVNTSGGITASDALIVLRRAVGQSIDLLCPACG